MWVLDQGAVVDWRMKEDDPRLRRKVVKLNCGVNLKSGRSKVESPDQVAAKTGMVWKGQDWDQGSRPWKGRGWDHGSRLGSRVQGLDQGSRPGSWGTTGIKVHDRDRVSKTGLHS